MKNLSLPPLLLREVSCSFQAQGTSTEGSPVQALGSVLCAPFTSNPKNLRGGCCPVSCTGAETEFRCAVPKTMEPGGGRSGSDQVCLALELQLLMAMQSVT